MSTEPFPVAEYEKFAKDMGITWPTPGGIRFHIRQSQRNGLEAALIRNGGRILIDPVKFLEWRKGSRKIIRPVARSGAAPEPTNPVPLLDLVGEIIEVGSLNTGGRGISIQVGTGTLHLTGLSIERMRSLALLFGKRIQITVSEKR